jgi:hypothetical protein
MLHVLMRSYGNSLAMTSQGEKSSKPRVTRNPNFEVKAEFLSKYGFLLPQ